MDQFTRLFTVATMLFVSGTTAFMWILQKRRDRAEAERWKKRSSRRASG